MPKTKFICQHCGNEFERWASKYPDGIAKYCSLKCNGLAQKDKETDARYFIKCDNCNKDFLIYKNRINKSKNHFCSMSCHDEYRNKQVDVICQCCGNTFRVKKARYELYNPRFCSWTCRTKFLKGKDHFNFTSEEKTCLECGNKFYSRKSEIAKGKGLYCSKKCFYKSLTIEGFNDNVKFYSTEFWKDLREQCYKRDNYSCQICNSKTNIHAHHKKPRRLNGEDKLENLITLCGSCHIKAEKKYKIK